MTEKQSAAHRKLHADLVSAVKAEATAKAAFATQQQETATERKRAAEIVRKAEAQEREKFDRLCTAMGRRQYLEAQLAVQGNGQAGAAQGPAIHTATEDAPVPGETATAEATWQQRPRQAAGREGA